MIKRLMGGGWFVLQDHTIDVLDVTAAQSRRLYCTHRPISRSICDTAFGLLGSQASAIVVSRGKRYISRPSKPCVGEPVIAPSTGVRFRENRRFDELSLPPQSPLRAHYSSYRKDHRVVFSVRQWVNQRFDVRFTQRIFSQAQWCLQ